MSWKCDRCNHYTGDGQKHHCINDEVEELQAKLERAEKRAFELEEALRSARGWVSTHVMQTYSRVAAKELEVIDALLDDKLSEEVK